jgi:hypothetical protein
MGSFGGDSVRSKILFWLALAMATIGMHSPEGHLFYFFAVHLSMILIGCLLHRREKRGRKAMIVAAKPPKSAAANTKAKPA